MPTTPTYGLPYPAPDVTPDVPYDLQKLAEAVEAAFAPAWITYTPVLTGSLGTNPTIGTGTGLLTGRYQILPKRCTGIIRLVLGTGATLGSGTWSYTLPVALSAASIGGVVGYGRYRTNAGVFVPAQLEGTPGTNTVTVLTQTPSSATPNFARQTNSVPAGQGAGDIWEFRFDYEKD